jgi:hypothetical protein
MTEYVFYKTTCTANGKFYFGVHLSDAWKDKYYIGCGVGSNATAKRLAERGVKSAFIRAVAKYGYKAFRKAIIRRFQSESEAYAIEAAVVNKKLVHYRKCYNCKVGGGVAVSDKIKVTTELLNIKTGAIHRFESRSACARHIGAVVSSQTLNQPLVGRDWVPTGQINPIRLYHKDKGWCWFANIRAAATQIQLEHGSQKQETGRIKEVLTGERNHVRGYFASEANARLPHNDGLNRACGHINKPVEANGVIYPSCRQAALALFNNPNLGQSIRYNIERNKSYRGIEFRMASQCQ